jgi:acyl carrier protein
MENMKNLLSERDTQVVLQTLSDELGVPQKELTPEANLTSDFSADSLTLITITMALEDRLGISIPDERSEKVQTIGDLFEMLAELLQERPSRNVQ